MSPQRTTTELNVSATNDDDDDGDLTHNTTRCRYALFNAMSGQKLFCEMANQGFNIFYSAFPILLLGVYDRDVSAATAMRYAQLYAPGVRDAYFNSSVFWGWLVQALYEGLLFVAVPLYAMPRSLEELGMMTSLWEYGAVSFTCVVLAANVKIALNQVLKECVS